MIFRFDAVGDFILSSPAIREIRSNFPNAFITLVVNKQVYPMAELCPYVNEVMAFEMYYSEMDIFGTFQSICEFAKKFLWRRRYNLSFCLNGWVTFPKLFMSYISGAKERVAYIMEAQLQYTNQLPPPEKDFSYLFLTRPLLQPKEIVHACANVLYLLVGCGLKVEFTDMEVWFNSADKFYAKKLLENFAPNKLKIVVGIGANAPARKYPIEKYLVAFKEIVKKDAALILLGGPSEVEDAKFLQENLPAESVLNLVGVSGGWRIDSAITAQADLYIGNDTGTMHLAVVAKLPVIYPSRIAKDRKKHFPNEPTEIEGAFPWQTKVILLQPEHQLGECAVTPGLFGCISNTSHCIAQIKPEEIVSAFDTMKNFLKSEIKEIKCPPIIKQPDKILKILCTSFE